MSLNAGQAQVLTLIVVLLITVVVLLVLVRTRRRPRTDGSIPPGRDGGPPRAAVIVHGTKVDDSDARRRQIEVGSGELGWAEPVWLPTTAEDPGHSQTVKALAERVDQVLVFGGDGTARVVAGVLAGTSVPMGLLPAGTGNLLARNLGIPPNRLESSLHIALTGRPRTIDIGRAEFARTLDGQELPVAEPFMVMAGLGFDAEVMADTDPALKQRLGWAAYIVSGLRRLRGLRTPVTISVDEDPPQHRRVRAVVIGNCGTLQGGIQLMPGALLDDGWLDVVIVAPRSLLGWLTVTRAVITRKHHSTVQHLRCRRIEIRAERPLAVQFDGDPAGEAQILRAHVEPLAVVIRVPG